jgi:dihydrofolate reductase
MGIYLIRLVGRVIYQMMEAAGGRRRMQERGLNGWNPSPGRSTRKEVRRVEHPGPGRLERGACGRDLEKAVQELKGETGRGLFVAGVKPPQALADLGLIDEYEFVVHPRLPGRGPTLFAGYRSLST